MMKPKNPNSDEVTTAAEGQLVTPLVNALVKQVKALKQPYAKLSEMDQAQLISNLDVAIRDFARDAINVIAAAQSPSFEVKISDTYSVKEHELTVKVSAATTDEFVIGMTRASGAQALLVLPNHKLIDDGSIKKVTADKQEPELPISKTPPDGPPGDTDLLEAGEKVAADRAEVKG